MSKYFASVECQIKKGIISEQVITWGIQVTELPCVSAGKESAYNAGDLGSIPGLGRSPSREKQKSAHSSILAWRVPWTVLELAESDVTDQLSLSHRSYWLKVSKIISREINGVSLVAQWQRIHLQGMRCKRHAFNHWVERSPAKGNGNPLQHSCLGNLMNRGAWWATVHEVTRIRHNLATKPRPQSRKWK